MSNASPQTASAHADPQAKASGPDPLLGRTISERFKIVGLIARGGMGKVYKAEQAPLGRVCAVKVLNPNYSGDHDPEFHKRFFLEASISSKLTHPNTVTIFDYGRTDDNVYYMAMEFLEGRTLHRMLRDEGPFTEERATHIARQICRSLREAHSLGVIHRDLKPANIYLIEHGDEHDFVKVLDFGLVKNIDETQGEDLTQTGLFMGSPKYMAPEQIRGEHVDARTDIYALGVIMYEMLTGKVPFDRPNSVNILMAHVNEPVPALRVMNPDVQVSEAFEQTIFKCVEKQADNRFMSMDEVLGALKRVGGGMSTGTMTGPAADRSGQFDLLSTTGSFTPQPIGPGIAELSASGNVLAASGSITADQQPKKSKLPLILGAALLAGGILAAVMLLGGKDDKKAAADTAPTSSTPVKDPKDKEVKVAGPSSSVTPPVTASAPVVAVVEKLRVDSDPTGAVVRDADDAVICDKTPCDIEVNETAKTLKIDLKDYGIEKIAVKKGDAARQVKLTKKATWTAPAGPTKPKDDGKPKDFKESPY